MAGDVRFVESRAVKRRRDADRAAPGTVERGGSAFQEMNYTDIYGGLMTAGRRLSAVSAVRGREALAGREKSFRIAGH